MTQSLNEILKNYSGESINIKYDNKSKSIFILCIHNTALGPSIGGCRWIEFGSLETAVLEAIKLAKIMTYKNTLANLSFGGAKAVILSNTVDRTLVLNRYAEFVNSFGGDYITSVDSGTDENDMYLISKITPYVTGYVNQINQCTDPSYYTAVGVFHAMKAALFFQETNNSLQGKKIIIQGIGKTGGALAKLLLKEKADVYFYDTNEEAVKLALQQFQGVQFLDLSNVDKIEADIFCPCALSNAINKENISRLKVKAIVGSANNQLECDSLARDLSDRGIIYCPDLLVNSGGVIHATEAYLATSSKLKYDESKTLKKLESLCDITLDILKKAAKHRVTPLDMINSIVKTKEYCN